ncbi:MAG: hypothetical protein EBS01_03465 [Verrucomicrobia bacterium]|nr:hypothetical protein [Verrucomicrobiota bacterium]
MQVKSFGGHSLKMYRDAPRCKGENNIFFSAKAAVHEETRPCGTAFCVGCLSGRQKGPFRSEACFAALQGEPSARQRSASPSTRLFPARSSDDSAAAGI